MGRYDDWQEMVQKLPETKGISMHTIVQLPAQLTGLLRTLIQKREMRLGDLAAAFNLSSSEAANLCQMLLQKGYLKTKKERETGQVVYRANLARAHGRAQFSDLWDQHIDEGE